MEMEMEIEMGKARGGVDWLCKKERACVSKCSKWGKPI